MPLKNYRDKRDFSRSKEPFGTDESGSKGKNLIYVIQEHHARRLHYDLRLEMGGVLKSWAIPKEPPLQPGVRRLAIKTEDHPLEYADFEGCFEFHTKVLTDEGLLNIGDIVERKLRVNVLSFNFREKRLEWKPVVGWFKNGRSSNFLELWLSNNHSTWKVTLTPNHVIYTPSRKKKAGKLGEGDPILIKQLEGVKGREISVGKVRSIMETKLVNLEKYDIMVEGNHNYFAESLLVSNSIPEGLYGAGLVKIWDRGTYVPIEAKENKLVFEIFGTRLRGKYVLIKTRWRGKGNYWLFFKMKND